MQRSSVQVNRLACFPIWYNPCFHSPNSCFISHLETCTALSLSPEIPTTLSPMPTLVARTSY